MNYKKSFYLFIFLSFYFLSSNVEAAVQEKYSVCDNCNSVASYSWHARLQGYSYPSGVYNVSIVNTENFDIWNVRIDVQVYNDFGTIHGFEDISVNVLDVTRESQTKIDELAYLYNVSKTTMVFDVSDELQATTTCVTAGCNSIDSVSAWLRGRNQINAWITASVSPSLINLFKQYFGKKPELFAVVIFKDGSTEKFKFKAAVATTVAFVRVPGTATNPDGTPIDPNNSNNLLNGLELTEENGTSQFNLGGGTIFIESSGSSCEWWQFVTTVNGEVTSVIYECL